MGVISVWLLTQSGMQTKHHAFCTLFFLTGKGDGGGQRVEGEKCGLFALFNYVMHRVAATTIFTETANWEGYGGRQRGAGRKIEARPCYGFA